ncbi:hypothetical protein D0A39_22530 [Xanthomonas campestris pv. campestris]|nr:hypothetical protein D0A39_22530 [Xanthomonas campestris pv. campestris]
MLANDAAIGQMSTAVAVGMVRDQAVEVLHSLVVITLLRIRRRTGSGAKVSPRLHRKHHLLAHCRRQCAQAPYPP